MRTCNDLRRKLAALKPIATRLPELLCLVACPQTNVTLFTTIVRHPDKRLALKKTVDEQTIPSTPNAATKPIPRAIEPSAEVHTESLPSPAAMLIAYYATVFLKAQ